jgi:ribosomal protein L7/L12
MVENVPATILTNAERSDAELVQRIFHDIGAAVELIAVEPQS